MLFNLDTFHSESIPEILQAPLQQTREWEQSKAKYQIFSIWWPFRAIQTFAFSKTLGCSPTERQCSSSWVSSSVSYPSPIVPYPFESDAEQNKQTKLQIKPKSAPSNNQKRANPIVLHNSNWQEQPLWEKTKNVCVCFCFVFFFFFFFFFIPCKAELQKHNRKHPRHCDCQSESQVLKCHCGCQQRRQANNDDRWKHS